MLEDLVENEHISCKVFRYNLNIKIDYYYSNSISRASKTMSDCRNARSQINKTGTNNL